MSYDELSAHAEDIERLAKEKYEEITENGTTVHPPEGCYSPAGACTSTYYSVEDYAEVLFGGVSSLFDDWTDLPSPSVFDAPMAKLDTVLSVLSEGGYTEGAEGGRGSAGGANTWITDVGPTGTYMQDWVGQAAYNYAAYVAPRFGPTASNQFGLAAGLRNVLMAEQALWAAAREDVDLIAHQAIEQLNGINGDGGGGDWSMTFTVIGAVVGVAGTVATGGTGAAIAWSAAGALISVAGSAGGGERSYAGATPSQVVESARQALTDLNSDIVAVERELIRALRSDIETARGLFPPTGASLDRAGLWQLVLPAPGVVTRNPIGVP